MIKIYCMVDIIPLDITNLVKSVSNSGDSSTFARALSITLAYPIWDTNQPRIDVKVGSKIWMILDGEEIFRGVVWTVDSSSEQELTIKAFDYLIYVNKSKVTYNFTNITPEDATRKVCSDLGIETGEIASTGTRTSRLIAQKTGCEAILEMYDQVQANGFILTMQGTKLNVIKKAQLVANYIVTINKNGIGNNAISVSYGESLDSMVNKVQIFDSDNNYHNKVENTEWQNKYGTLQDNYVMEDGKNPATEAQKLLKGIEHTWSVETLGNWECRTGSLVGVKIFYMDEEMEAKLLIDGDTHTWDVGTNKYTMQLNLATC